LSASPRFKDFIAQQTSASNTSTLSHRIHHHLLSQLFEIILGPEQALADVRELMVPQQKPAREQQALGKLTLPALSELRQQRILQIAPKERVMET
jgi:hypothetical protein